MKCTVTYYLEEKEIECLRLAHSANHGTKEQLEWLKTYDALLRRRREHEAGCKNCSNLFLGKQNNNIKNNS